MDLGLVHGVCLRRSLVNVQFASHGVPAFQSTGFRLLAQACTPLELRSINVENVKNVFRGAGNLALRRDGRGERPCGGSRHF